jgi:hypothetical protein
MHPQSTTFQLLVLKFTYERLQWIHKRSFSTPQSTHVQSSHQAAQCYHVVVAGGCFSDQQRTKRLYIFLMASNLLVMMTNCARCVHMNTELRSNSMSGPKFHSLNGSYTWDWQTLNQGKQYIILYGAVAGTTKINTKFWKTLDWENQNTDFTVPLFNISLQCSHCINLLSKKLKR